MSCWAKPAALVEWFGRMNEWWSGDCPTIRNSLPAGTSSCCTWLLLNITDFNWATSDTRISVSSLMALWFCNSSLADTQPIPTLRSANAFYAWKLSSNICLSVCIMMSISLLLSRARLCTKGSPQFTTRSDDANTILSWMYLRKKHNSILLWLTTKSTSPRITHSVSQRWSRQCHDSRVGNFTTHH